MLMPSFRPVTSLLNGNVATRQRMPFFKASVCGHIQIQNVCIGFLATQINQVARCVGPITFNKQSSLAYGGFCCSGFLAQAGEFVSQLLRTIR